MKRSIRIAITVFACVLFVGTAVGAAYIRNLPVSWDAGACGGGYATYVFDKYHEELTEKYCDGLEDDLDVSSFEAIRGTHEAEWEGQTLFLEFDVQYEHPVQGTVTERVGFVGQRTWIDTYDWSGAIVEAR